MLSDLQKMQFHMLQPNIFHPTGTPSYTLFQVCLLLTSVDTEKLLPSFPSYGDPLRNIWKK